MAVGFALIPLGIVGVLIPFTLHLGGVFAILGLILVLRNSRAWRRRFIRLQRRYPRWLHPVRRILRGEVLPVLWHEALRTERFLVRRPGWRRLAYWRRRLGGRRRRGRKGRQRHAPDPSSTRGPPR